MSATVTLRRRPSLAAAALYAVLALLFVAPSLLPGRHARVDRPAVVDRALDGRAPRRRARLRREHRDGRRGRTVPAVHGYTRSRLPDIPLWNPYNEGGRPFNANMQSAIFSPFSWPAYMLPFWWSLGLIGALKLWVPAFGTFLLARRLGSACARCWRASSPASASFTWCGSPGRCRACGRGCRGCCWRPTTWCENRPPRAFAGLAVVVALQYFGGHPETSFHVLAVGAAVRAAAHGAARARPRAVVPRRRGRRNGAGGARPAPVPRAARPLVGPGQPLRARAGAHAAALRARARAAGLLGAPDAAGARARSSSPARSTRARCR